MDRFPLPMLNAFIGKKLLKLLGFIGKKVVTLQPKQWKKVADMLPPIVYGIIDIGKGTYAAKS